MQEKRNYFGAAWHSAVTNASKFSWGLHKLVEGLRPHGTYTGDNLIAFGRNLSFLDDASFMVAANRHLQEEPYHSAIWRYYVLCWAARNGLRLDGDLVECGSYEGVSGAMLADYLALTDSGKQLFLYDLFDHQPGMRHHRMPGHSADLYERVKTRFADYPAVHVIQGEVPTILETVCPERVCFLHLDLNDADAETGALEVLYDRMPPGAFIVLDDYGWSGYRPQRDAADRFFSSRERMVVELPTGQGLVIT